MRHIPEFSFIEKIAVVGLDEFYKLNYSDDFLICNYRDGLSFEIILIKPFENSWEIAGKEISTSDNLRKLTFSSKAYSTIEESIEAYLTAKNVFSSENSLGWTIQRQKDDYYAYEVIIRHFEKKPTELSTLAKFEKWFELYFENQFESLYQFLVNEVKNIPDEFVLSRNEERLTLLEIASYENKLIGLLEEKQKRYEAKYKDDLYLKLIEHVTTLYKNLKAEFPIIYPKLEITTEKRIEKLTWYPNAKTFFYLFYLLKAESVIRTDSNSKVSYQRLAENLMKAFQIPTEKGNKEEYTAKTFAKNIEEAEQNFNNRHFEKFKPLVKELIQLMKEVD